MGSVQVGMLLGLAEAGVRPDLIVGTSVGAINGGWIASRSDVDGVAALARLWRSLSRNAVFPAKPLTGLLGFAGRRRNLVPSSGLRRLVEDNIEFTRLEDAPVPFHVVATDVLSGEDVLLSTGDAVDAILASAAIPGVFPPVSVGGRDMIDGGVVNNTPLSHAVALGADTIWVLPTGFSCSLPAAPRGALAMALHGLALTVNQRLAVEIRHYEQTVDLRVIPPPCMIRVSPADFSQSADLITRTHESTRTWLTTSHPTTGQAELIGAHSH